jgi:hypothetical protein
MKNQEKMPKIDTESMMLMNTWNTCKTIILLKQQLLQFLSEVEAWKPTRSQKNIRNCPNGQWLSND